MIPVCHCLERPGIFVAAAESMRHLPQHRLEWWECGRHGPTENIAGELRTNLTRLDRWLWLHGLGPWVWPPWGMLSALVAFAYPTEQGAIARVVAFPKKES